jgi:rhodanese-like protein
MAPKAVTIIDIALDRTDDEEAFLAWWAEATLLLTERAKLESAELAVFAQAKYQIWLEFSLPGSYKIAMESKPWQELEARRPPAHVEVRQARLFHRAGPSIDVTTSEMARWLDERSRNLKDFVLVDALSPETYAKGHIAGAVNLPPDKIDAESAARAIGDTERPVVIYCAHYG